MKNFDSCEAVLAAFQGSACLGTELLLCSNLEGYWIIHGDLSCVILGRRSWHAPADELRTGTGQEDPLGSPCFRSPEQLRPCAFSNQNLFGYSEKHFQGSPRLYPGAVHLYGSLIATHEEGHVEGNPFLSAFWSPSKKTLALRTVVCMYIEDLRLPRQPVVG